jgi:hypothetical protein
LNAGGPHENVKNLAHIPVPEKLGFFDRRKANEEEVPFVVFQEIVAIWHITRSGTYYTLYLSEVYKEK